MARRAEGRRVGESVIIGRVGCNWEPEVWLEEVGGERRWRVASRKGLRFGVVNSRLRVGLEGVRALKMVERVMRDRVSVAVGSGRPSNARTNGTQLFAHAPRASGLLSTLALTNATPAHFPCVDLLWRRDDTRVLYLWRRTEVSSFFVEAVWKAASRIGVE